MRDREREPLVWVPEGPPRDYLQKNNRTLSVAKSEVKAYNRSKPLRLSAFAKTTGGRTRLTVSYPTVAGRQRRQGGLYLIPHSGTLKIYQAGLESLQREQTSRAIYRFLEEAGWELDPPSPNPPEQAGFVFFKHRTPYEGSW